MTGVGISTVRRGSELLSPDIDHELVAWRGPRVTQRRRLTTMAFRGSITRRLISLSTLRSGGYPLATQDSLPAAGPALPDGIGYPQDSQRKVSSLWLFSFPELLGAMGGPFRSACRPCPTAVCGCMLMTRGNLAARHADCARL